jgi:hypothetical protein
VVNLPLRLVVRVHCSRLEQRKLFSQVARISATCGTSAAARFHARTHKDTEHNACTYARARAPHDEWIRFDSNRFDSIRFEFS